MYDMTRENSFTQMKNLFKDYIYFQACKNVEFMILGNKKDLTDLIEVPLESVETVRLYDVEMIILNNFLSSLEYLLRLTKFMKLVQKRIKILKK